VAATDSTVLLRGESGTGKDLFARTIHALSRRAGGPWVKVNCGALPEALLESELFGHEKGAFTGAVRQKAGRFEDAHGGTLFLDEIGEMPLALQVKLLQAIEEKTFTRVGGNRPLTVDARIITATNRPLEDMVRARTFREDLFFRLNVFPIVLPPLRERPGDVPKLVEHVLRRQGAPPDKLTWVPRIPPEGLSLEALEKELILQALERAAGNKSAAARLLGLTRRTLYSRMEKHGLRTPGEADDGDAEGD